MQKETMMTQIYEILKSSNKEAIVIGISEDNEFMVHSTQGELGVLALIETFFSQHPDLLLPFLLAQMERIENLESKQAPNPNLN
jgi:hypothetical protein